MQEVLLMVAALAQWHGGLGAPHQETPKVRQPQHGSAMSATMAVLDIN